MAIDEYPCIYLSEGCVHIQNMTYKERQQIIQQKKGYIVKYYPIVEYQEPKNQALVTSDAQEIADAAKLQLIDHRGKDA